jgi:8-oxo-dGTP pyrophosphatase MutT (NUDIX family)
MDNIQITELKNAIEAAAQDESISKFFLRRLDVGALTKDEDQENHFCVYFAGLDPVAKMVFIGHHKKSGLWLFNGGHMDRDETPSQSLRREIGEEWGESFKIGNIPSPGLLTITEIDNRPKQTCRRHYDIWFFIPLDKNNFAPDRSLLSLEFYENGWKTLAEALILVKDPGTIIALDYLKKIL